MKKRFIKTPLVGVQVHGAKDVGTRTVNLLMGEHAGEYVRGDIMDANAVIQAFDEIKGSVDSDHDSLAEIVDGINNLRDATDQNFQVFQEKIDEETVNRTNGDNAIDDKINTEKQDRVNADTQLRNDLATEVNRANASENTLASNIQAEATKRENDDNTIKDNLNAEVTRATAKENEIKAQVDVINGDSTTEGSFRKAIADIVGAAPEAYDTLKEIADKLNSNDDLHTTINEAIATKATTTALNEEITRAKAAEAENKAEIAAEAARAKEVEGDNALAIQNEESRATTAETAINESINTEIDRAKGQEAYLQNLVNAKADTTALDGAKEELDKKISDETARATDEEDELRSLIATEQNRATASEKSIADDLNGKLVQKADTTALYNYVLTTALNEQVSTLNAAIDTKQPKGNYLTEHQDLSEYAKKTEVPTNISSLTNDSKFITIDDVDFTQYAKTVDLTNEINRAKSEESTIKETLNTKYDSNNIPVASKESLGIAKVGYGLNVNAGVISIAPDYLVDMMSYGVEWDVTVADPTCTRIGNPLFHKSLPIQSEYKGCIVKNGKLQYYLNPNDWTKTSNGSNSNLDGTDGDVMIHTPKFYGKSGSNGNKRWVRISTVKVDASWVEIPEMFISAYHNTIYTDGNTTKIASVVSTNEKYRGGGRRSEYDQYLATDQFKTDLGKPVSNISRATMRTYAEATGQELLCYEFYKWIFYWNYVIEYANFNSQKEFNSELTSDGYHQGGLGPGLTTFDYNSWKTYNGNYAITPCGYTNEFGNFSGVKAIQLQSPKKTLYANRWRGFENPFGDIWTNLEGIVIKRDAAKANSNVYTTTYVSKYGEDYSLFDIAGVEIAKDGFIGTFDLGSKAEIIPSSIAGSESTYKCDYHWCNANYVEKRTLMVGGCASNGGGAGLGCFYSVDGVGIAAAHVGFRSLVRV